MIDHRRHIKVKIVKLQKNRDIEDRIKFLVACGLRLLPPDGSNASKTLFLRWRFGFFFKKNISSCLSKGLERKRLSLDSFHLVMFY